MYISILILPFLGSLVSGLLGRKIGVTGAHLITCTCLILSSILATVAFYEVGICGSPVSIHLTNWVDSEFMSISWEFLFDQLTVAMFIPVLYISSLIHIFSTDYMSEDPAECFGKTFKWGKLPNSGDTLKLLIPSYSRKALSGQNNYLDTVISQEINESEMGYRGSKSVLLNSTVKEQRVDGSYFGFNPKLRCTLMNFERISRVKFPSKQLNVRNFSSPCCPYGRDAFSSNSSAIINPWFWTGLIDAEGSFSVIVSRSKSHKTGWRVEPKFQMGLHGRDLTLLLLLQQNLGGVGAIYKNSTLNIVNYTINSKKDLLVLISHLEKYPLLTQKGADFILFKEVVNLMNNKAHLSIQGLNQIINIKASINLGLSDFLKSEFSKFTPVERQIINTEIIPDPNWVAGFVTGDGGFDIRIIQQSSNSSGYRVQLRFRITQHERDLKLMEVLVKYLGSGRIYKYAGKPAVALTVFNFSHISNLIIPFFEKNPLLGVKLIDYLDWCKVAKLINEGSHLTKEGVNLIREIKSGMNKGRDNNNI